MITQPDDERIDRRVLGLLMAFVRSAKRVGRHPLRSAGDELERAARSFSRRIVRTSISDPRPIDDAAELRTALIDDQHAAVIGGATAALAAMKVLERVGPLKLIAKRTPWLVVASGLPTAYASFARGADELASISSFLVNRSREAGNAADPDRLRRITIQVLQGQPIDPSAEPSHRDLVTSWAWRAARTTLPFGGRGASRRARRMAAAADSVDLAVLSAVP